jgi:hypothetical protein
MTEKRLDELILQLKIQNQLLSRLVLVQMVHHSQFTQNEIMKEIVRLLNGELDIDNEEVIKWANGDV